MDENSTTFLRQFNPTPSILIYLRVIMRWPPPKEIIGVEESEINRIFKIIDFLESIKEFT